MKIFRRNYALKELQLLSKSISRLILRPKKILNFFLVKISVLLKLKRCLGLPLNVFIEPTGECNYKCLKCERFSSSYIDDGEVFKNRNMPFDQFKNIIDEIGDTMLSLRLWHFGEPLLHNDIFGMIAYAKRHDIIVGLSSNMSLLTPDISEKLIKADLDYLVVSLDSASEKIYEYYNGHNTFKKVIDNIRALIDAKKRLKISFPFIELQFIVMKKNESEINAIKALADELGVDKLSYLRLDATDIDFTRPDGVSSQEDILPANDLFRFDLEKIRQIKFCRIPWEEAVIRYSGTVLPCVCDIGQKYNMGTLFSNGHYASFQAIWNNSDYQTFRDQSISTPSGINMCLQCTPRDNNVDSHIDKTEIEKAVRL